MDRYKKLIAPLETNLQEAEAQSKRIMQVAVVVEKATPPGAPSFPHLMLNVVVALFAGLAGSLFYCFFVDYLESTKDKRIFRLLKALRASEDLDE